MKNSQTSVSRGLLTAFCGSATLALAMTGVLTAALAMMAPTKADATPTRSTTIALTADEQRIVVVNRARPTVSRSFKVKNSNGKDLSTKIRRNPGRRRSRAASRSTQQ